MFRESLGSKPTFEPKFLNDWSTMTPNFRFRSIMKKEIQGFKVEVFRFKGSQESYIEEL